MHAHTHTWPTIIAGSGLISIQSDRCKMEPRKSSLTSALFWALCLPRKLPVHPSHASPPTKWDWLWITASPCTDIACSCPEIWVLSSVHVCDKERNNHKGSEGERIWSLTVNSNKRQQSEDIRLQSFCCSAVSCPGTLFWPESKFDFFYKGAPKLAKCTRLSDGSKI